ncbi:MAG TPA: methyltransferase domain-containing protein, partial [Kofleriaceae bacterium]|nr:methyltransferase domain-containing protein [Kofleriaceae bacterium]
MRYTSDRGRLASPADRAGDLAARAVFFTVADAMKLAVPLGELANRGALPARRPLRVVDLGAGCGAMSLGLVAALGGEPALSLELLAIDHDAGALAIAAAAIRDLAARSGVPSAVVTRAADALKVSPDEADLVVMGSLLNELPADRALGVVERALRALSPDGA